MNDIPTEIPTIEANSIEPETGSLEINNASDDLTEGLSKNSEEIENREEGLKESEKEKPLEEGPSDSEILDVGKERIANIDEDVESTLNNPLEPPNNYLIKQLKEPEAQDPEVGKEQLLKIDEINQQIEEEGNKARKDIAELLGLESENPNNEEVIEGEVIIENKENLVEEVDEPGETPPSEEVIEGEWGWLDEELDPKIEDFFKDIGEEELTGSLSPEDLKIFEDIRQSILDRFPAVGSTSSLGTLNSMLDAMPNEESDATKDTIKILLRLAVRIGTRIVAFIADEIVKSTDKDDKTTKFIFGSIRDAAKGVESAADTLITGEERTERLTKTIRNRLFQKTNDPEKSH